MIDGEVSASTGRTTADEPVRRRAQTAALDPLAARAEDLRGLVKDLGAKPRPRAVHHLRTTIRRFETLLPEPDGMSPRGDRKVRAQLDRIRKRAGKVRDVDVHLLALRGLPKDLESEAQTRLRDGFRKLRGKREKRLVQAVAAEREDGLLKRLRKVVAQTAMVGPQNDADRERILEHVIARFDQELQAVTPLGAESLHEFRLRTKRLRYLAETAAPSARAAIAVAQLKRVQDAIGAWHDWLTLAARAEKIVGEEATALLDALRARTEVRLAKAVKVTTAVGRRLLTLRSTGARRGTRPVTPASSVAALRSAGASA